jgi:hypothetical protein
VRILPSITPAQAPFEHFAQTATSKIEKALTGLNGQILPVEVEEGETLHSVQVQFYTAAKRLDITELRTRVFNGTVYVWQGGPSTRGRHVSTA